MFDVHKSHQMKGIDVIGWNERIKYLPTACVE